MKQNVILRTIVMLLFYTTVVRAQDSTVIDKPKSLHVQMHLSLRYLRNDASSFNNALSRQGYTKVSENVLGADFSPTIFTRRFMLSNILWFYFMPSVKNTTTTTTTEMEGMSSELLLGYTVLDKPKLRVTPYLGFNSNMTNFRITEDAPPASFSGLLTEPRKEVELNFTNNALDFGVQAERMFNLRNRNVDCPQNVRYMTLGLKAGYLLRLDNKPNGSYNNKVISDSPVFGLQGMYLSLIFSHGTKIRQLKWR